MIEITLYINESNTGVAIWATPKTENATVGEKLALISQAKLMKDVSSAICAAAEQLAQGFQKEFEKEGGNFHSKNPTPVPPVQAE